MGRGVRSALNTIMYLQTISFQTDLGTVHCSWNLCLTLAISPPNDLLILVVRGRHHKYFMCPVEINLWDLEEASQCSGLLVTIKA